MPVKLNVRKLDNFSDYERANQGNYHNNQKIQMRALIT